MFGDQGDTLIRFMATELTRIAISWKNVLVMFSKSVPLPFLPSPAGRGRDRVRVYIIYTA